jgi:hypothetical protein
VFSQLALRVQDKIDRSKDIDPDDMQAVLQSAVLGGKITVWNQLYIQHESVSFMFSCQICLHFANW